ncbi:MAG: 4-(cytidine 5'-diphospho)-2-C-methyl-D-erythritol kinase, partial [Raoultibacter sp.]
IRAWAQGCSGVRAVLLCGSGSATFVVCENVDAALALASEAKKRGWWARATSFSTTRAALVPAH